MNNIYNKSVLVLIALLVIVLASCQWDGYDDYTEGGEIIYPGKVMFSTVLSGENRVKIIGLLGPDPKVSNYRIYWNDNKDSIEYEATEEAKTTGFAHVLNMEEGVRTFILYTYDMEGNVSIPIGLIGTSYGEIYRRKMINRTVDDIKSTDSSKLVIWKSLDTSFGANFTEVEYESGGEKRMITGLAKRDTFNLIGLTDTATIHYRTAYIPSAGCIDTLYTDLKTYQIK